MDRIEKVKKILEKLYWQGREHADIPITSISVEGEFQLICQLFEPKPDDILSEHDIISVPETEQERETLGWHKLDEGIK